MIIFDIGMHKSEFTYANLQLASKIIAVEANPVLAQWNKSKWKDEPKVEVLHYAVCDHEGSVPFRMCDADTLSTISNDWITKSRFAGQYHWYKPINVPAITLDTLITQYGLPNLIKIDVEGSELEVIKGLSHKTDELCFEWVEEEPYKIEEIVTRLQLIGYSEFGYILSDAPLEKPNKFVPWHKLGLMEQLVPEKKEKWGMVYAR